MNQIQILWYCILSQKFQTAHTAFSVSPWVLLFGRVEWLGEVRLVTYLTCIWCPWQLLVTNQHTIQSTFWLYMAKSCHSSVEKVTWLT